MRQNEINVYSIGQRLTIVVIMNILAFLDDSIHKRSIPDLFVFVFYAFIYLLETDAFIRFA